MLLSMIERDQTCYDDEDIAKCLAESDANLGCEESCVDALVARGIRPWQWNGDFLQARVEANNIRAAKYWALKALGKAAEIVPLILLAALFVPHEALAVERIPQGTDIGGALLLMSIVVVTCVVALAWKPRKREED